eukprot:gene15529-18405_t
MVKQMIDPAPGNVAVVGCAPAQRGTTPGVVGPLDEHGADPGHAGGIVEQDRTEEEAERPVEMGGPPMEACDAPIVENGDDEGRDLSEVELDAVNRELLQPERVVRQRGAAYLSDGKDAYHRIARGGLVIPCLHAVFDAGLVGESGESMDPIPIIQTMEVEEDTVARGGLGVAEAATALPSEV